MARAYDEDDLKPTYLSIWKTQSTARRKSFRRRYRERRTERPWTQSKERYEQQVLYVLAVLRRYPEYIDVLDKEDKEQVPPLLQARLDAGRHFREIPRSDDGRTARHRKQFLMVAGQVLHPQPVGTARQSSHSNSLTAETHLSKVISSRSDG